MKYSSLLASWLKSEGYTTCFFVAGGGIMHLLDGFRTEFKCISVIHEHSAGVCAEHFNECRTGNERAFALVTTGPGLTNIVTAIAGCYVEHRELLVISGQVKSTDLLEYPQRQRGVQEIDAQGIVKNITVSSICLTQPIGKDHFISIVQTASSPHPGPVVIEVCLDVQGMRVDANQLNIRKLGTPIPDVELGSQLKILQKKIREAERPVLLFGGLLSRKTVSDYFSDLERLNIPCATTTSAIDRIPNDSKLYVGRTGTWGGQRAANLIIAQADLVISIGAQLDLQQTGFNYESFCPSAELIKVFPSNVELERLGPKSEMQINCNPDIFLKFFLSKVEWSDEFGWVQYKNNILENFPALEQANIRDTKLINPFIFLQNLSKASDKNDILAFCSSGGTFTAALQVSEIKREQIVTTSAAHASMGYGLATAIGAAFANPDRRIIATEGEGGFVQNLQELALLKKHNLNIKLFVFDNSGYASIRATQKKFFGGEYLGCDPDTGLSFPKWHLLFQAYDIPSETITLDNENVETLRSKLGLCDGPTAFIVKVDPDQANWPAVATILKDDGRLESAPLFAMLPEITTDLMRKYGKYLESK